MDLGGICRYWARWQPESVAILCRGRPVTWVELDRRTDAIAAGLAERGIASGDRLGILGQNSIGWCELVVAGFKLGAAVVPLNIRLAPEELRYIITHAGCAAVAVDAELAPRYDEIAGDLGSCLRLRLEGRRGRGRPSTTWPPPAPRRRRPRSTKPPWGSSPTRPAPPGAPKAPR